LGEARRVLLRGGALTAIEVDYNTVWASPSTPGLDAVFDAVVRAMEAGARSDAGSRVAGWLAEAGFGSVDPGERRLAYSGAGLARQTPYVASVVESTLPELSRASGASTLLLEQGLEDLRSLPSLPEASIGWVVHKATARR
jgi:hypothetical protein